jgi:hypothetical protein
MGALTIKSYTYESRPWEFKRLVFPNFISTLPLNLMLFLKYRTVKRILPWSRNDFISNSLRFNWSAFNSIFNLHDANCTGFTYIKLYFFIFYIFRLLNLNSFSIFFKVYIRLEEFLLLDFPVIKDFLLFESQFQNTYLSNIFFFSHYKSSTIFLQSLKNNLNFNILSHAFFRIFPDVHHAISRFSDHNILFLNNPNQSLVLMLWNYLNSSFLNFSDHFKFKTIFQISDFFLPFIISKKNLLYSRVVTTPLVLLNSFGENV